MFAVLFIANDAVVAEYSVKRTARTRDITIIDLTYDRAPSAAAIEAAVRTEVEAEAKRNPEKTAFGTAWLAGNDRDPLKTRMRSQHIIFEPKLKKVLTWTQCKAAGLDLPCRHSQGASGDEAGAVNVQVDYEVAKGEVQKRLEATQAYRDAAAETEAKRISLDEARESGGTRDKLSASADYNKARNALAKMKLNALADAKDILEPKRIAAQEADAVYRAAKAAKIAADYEERDRVTFRREIEAQQVVKGMTLDQARLAIKPENIFRKNGEAVTDTGDGEKSVVWEMRMQGELYRVIHAWINSGGQIYRVVETTYENDWSRAGLAVPR